MKNRLLTTLLVIFIVIPLHAITIVCSPSNGGTVSRSANWDGKQTMTATPKTGYRFVRWKLVKTKDGSQIWVSTKNPVDVLEEYVTHYYYEGGKEVQAYTLTAYFEKDTYTLTVKSNNTSYGTVSGGGTYEKGKSVTIKATPKTGYKFVKWNDGNTSASRSVTVNGNATYTATFEPIKYTITWKQDDGTTIDQTTVEYGKTPTHSNPTKASTAEYTYTFKAWSPAITTVTGNKTYTATYTATKRSYTITWLQDDGTTIDQTSVEYGITPTHSTPSKPADAEHTYTFVGWSPDITTVTGNQTYTATYTSAQNVYIITWLQDDGTQIDQTAVEYGVTPTHSAPTKPSTAEYMYLFAGWSPDITSVTGNQTYSATYTAVKREYAIIWLQDDGTELIEDSVEYGITPSYNGETPTKLATVEYSYTFAGWTPEVVPVTGDAIYTAKFDSTMIVYNVNVTIPDSIEVHGSVTVEGSTTFGDTITITPVPEDGWYFVEWSDGNTDNPREIIVTGDTVIYPIFAQCEEIIVTFSEVITKGESYDFAGMSLMQRGTYMDTTVLANGCDSITVLKLNVVKAKTFNLRVVVNDETMGTVEGAGTFTQGQEVTITAIPASSKYVFVRWYNEDEDINVYDNPYTFTLNRNLQIRAVFRRGKK